MNLLNTHNILRILFWMAVSILFAAPLEVLHSLFGLLHVLFEWTEASLDFMIELMFDTSLHTTQVIVFYIIIAVIFYGFYRLWKALPDFCRRQKINLRNFLSDEIEAILDYWQESTANKAKLLGAASVLFFLLFI